MKIFAAPLKPVLLTVRADEMEMGDILDEGVALQLPEVYKRDRIVRWLVGPHFICATGCNHHEMREWEPDEMVKVIRRPKWTELGEAEVN